MSFFADAPLYCFVHTHHPSPDATASQPPPEGDQSPPSVTASLSPTCAAYSESVAATISSFEREWIPASSLALSRLLIWFF